MMNVGTHKLLLTLQRPCDDRNMVPTSVCGIRKPKVGWHALFKADLELSHWRVHHRGSKASTYIQTRTHTHTHTHTHTSTLLEAWELWYIARDKFLAKKWPCLLWIDAIKVLPGLQEGPSVRVHKTRQRATLVVSTLWKCLGHGTCGRTLLWSPSNVNNFLGPIASWYRHWACEQSTSSSPIACAISTCTKARDSPESQRKRSRAVAYTS